MPSMTRNGRSLTNAPWWTRKITIMIFFPLALFVLYLFEQRLLPDHTVDGLTNGTPDASKATRTTRNPVKNNGPGYFGEQILFQDRIPEYLVMYAGPSGDSSKDKEAIYNENFEFFLKFGVHHNTNYASVDFVIVLTKKTIDVWKPRMESLGMPNLRWIIRESDPKCLDMGNVKDVLDRTDLEKYDRFISVNCGMIGPFLPTYIRGFVPWTSLLASFIDDNVKFAGVSQADATMGRPSGAARHVQSMVWVTDLIGLKAILDSGAIYDCNVPIQGRDPKNKPYLVSKYELGMSVAIKQAGYMLRSWNNVQINQPYCHDHTAKHEAWGEDQWWDKRYFGSTSTAAWGPGVVSPMETMFFKATRDVGPLRKWDMDQSFVRHFDQCDAADQTLNMLKYKNWHKDEIEPRR